MTIDIQERDGATYVAIAGRVDTVTAPQLDEAVPQICPEGSKGEIIADCAKMEYISSAGLRAFIVLLKRSKAMGRELTLENLSPSILSIFDMTGFTKLFNIKK